MSDTTFTGLLLDDVAPWVTPQQDPAGDHAIFLSALASMFEQVFGIVADQGDPEDSTYQPGWSILLDVDLCPTQFLPYLAQFVGAQIPVGSDDATARAIIRAESGLQRGTPMSVISAISRNLTGTQSVFLRERTAADGSADAYHFQAIVRPEELVWNMVPNPSFEEDTTGDAPAAWGSPSFGGAGSTTTFLVENSWAQAGAKSLRITGASVAAGTTMYGDLSSTMPCLAGMTYSEQATFNLLSAATEPQLSVYFYDSSSTVVGSETVTGVAGIGVQTLQLDGLLAPSTAVKANVFWALENTSGTAATLDAYMDAVQLVALPAITVYADGDQGGFGWSGTAGDSPTISTPGLTSAVNVQKPGGVQWTLIQSDAPLLSQYTRLFSAITVTLADATLADVT